MNPRSTLMVPAVALMLAAFGTTGTLAAPAADVAGYAVSHEHVQSDIEDEPLLELLDALGGAETDDVRDNCCAAICMMAACLICCEDPLVAECSCELGGVPFCRCGLPNPE